jgi:MtrB/PioB family decaheme-associated outer membrane protein
MKQILRTPVRRRPVAVAVIAALGALAATTALADPLLTVKLFRDSDVMFRDSDMSRWSENYVELGAGYNSQNSLRFGQFTGLTDKGGFPLAGFNWLARNEANDAQYWLVHGSNLGLDSRKVQVQGGIQGIWNASLSFEGLKKSQTESAQFYHNGLGTSKLTLRGATAVNPTGINTALLQPFEIQHGRDIYRIGLNALVDKEWDFKINYREDRRDGTRMTGLATTNIAGRGQAMIVPYQIDDKTQQIEAVLAYTAKDAQFQIGYHYSRFENALDKFDVQNPFSSVAGNLDQRLSLAPDNDYHQINATGAYRFNKTTRLSATYSYGIARQNQAFLPYSINGTTAAASTTAGLPRSSLDGKVVNTLFDVALTSKPLDKMNLKVAFQYRDSDNRTPIAQYAYVSRDAASGVCASGGGSPASACIRSNAPVSTTEKRLVVDGDYEIAPKTLLRASIDHNDKKYTLADRTDTQTDKLTIELRKPVADDFLGSLGYIYTQRRGSSYDKNVYFRNTYTDTSFQNAAGLTNNPSMRQFMWADFDENRIRASGSWVLSETLNLQGVAETYKQKMRGPNCGQFANPLEQVAITGGAMSSSTCLGRDTADGNSLSVDLQYQPEENLTTFAFANLSQTGVKQIGRTWSAASTTGGLDTKNWYGDILNRDQTLGFGLKWQPEEKWDLGGTYVFNHSIGKSGINQAATAAPSATTASTPVPDTWNKLHTLQLFAKWDYSKQLSWRFNYLYENLKSYDWALSDVGATSNVHVLFNGQQAPRYSNHVFGVSAVVKSW